MSPAPSPSKTVLIVGASRGLGLGLAREYLRRGWQVIATTRTPGNDSALHQLQEESGARLEIELLEINRPDQILALRAKLHARRLDVLFVNAGVRNHHEEKIGEASDLDFNRVMMTNALGPLRVIEQFSTSVPASGAIVAMSSFMGSIAHNTTGTNEVYRASKAALNTLLRSFSARENSTHAVIAMSPGWVRTDMGGERAPLDVETSVRGMIDVIDAEAGKPGARFLNYKGETIEW